MISFLKNIISSCLGTVLGLGLLILLLIGIGSAIGSLQTEIPIKTDSVLRLRFSEYIPERTNNLPMGLEFITKENIWGIHELAYAIEEAAKDSKIEAIIMETAPIQSFVHMDLLRQAIGKFKSTGKPVYAYGDFFDQSNLYLASKADMIYLNPLGQAELKGFAVIEPFMKDALDNMGIEMEVYYAGDFKSATEPFRRNEMSAENKTQLREFLNELYDNFLDSLSVSRGISKMDLRRMANTYASREASDAKRLGLVDVIGYDSDLISDLKKALNLDDKDKLNLVDIDRYRSSLKKDKNYFADEKIAIVYMEGEIREDEKEEGTISAKRYVPILRNILEDDKIKSVVLRINSPGGNAMTSDKILDEIKNIKLSGKTVIASFGDLAASGGYYIAAEADTIFASPQTITGSIGVFSMFPNVSNLFEERLNIYMDSVSTSPYAGMGSIILDRSEKERAIFQASTDSMYNVFLRIVAKGRNKSISEVHEVAQGRIWTGERALDLGLIDQIGDLDNAIASAARAHDMDDYRIVEYPLVKTPLQQLTEELNDMTDVNKQITNSLTSEFPQLKSYERLIKNSQHVQAWMPYQFILN